MEYLVDVGFGEFAFHPLKMEIDLVQKDPRGNFIIEKVKDKFIVSKIDGDKQSIEYSFINKARTLAEFRGMCIYQQTSPNSHFTQKKLITRPTKNGRITLTGNSLKITEDGMPKTDIEFPADAYAAQLRQWFKIEEPTVNSK